MGEWDNRRRQRAERLSAAAGLVSGKRVELARLVELLEAVIRPGDRVCLEGDNQGA